MYTHRYDVRKSCATHRPSRIAENCPEVKGSHKLILLALAEFANEEDECWPSIARLSEMTGLKDRQVQNLLRDLQSNGYIEIDTNHGRKNTNVYRITMVEKVQSTAPFIEGKKVQSSTEKVQSSTEKVQSSNIKGAADCTRSVIEPIVNTSSAAQTKLRVAKNANKDPVLVGQKVLTPQQEYFDALCWVVGWDTKTIGKEQSGQVAQTVGILQRASYTKDDLHTFWIEVWVKDWRWAKKRQRPTMAQVRSEIGKIRIKSQPAHMNGNVSKSVFSSDFQESEA